MNEITNSSILNLHGKVNGFFFFNETPFSAFTCVLSRPFVLWIKLLSLLYLEWKPLLRLNNWININTGTNATKFVIIPVRIFDIFLNLLIYSVPSVDAIITSQTSTLKYQVEPLLDIIIAKYSEYNNGMLTVPLYLITDRPDTVTKGYWYSNVTILCNVSAKPLCPKYCILV